MNRTEIVPARKQDAERRLLELELYQVRREADLARLEARAAEIEWLIQQLWLSDAATAADIRVASEDPNASAASEKHSAAGATSPSDRLSSLDPRSDADLEAKVSRGKSQAKSAAATRSVDRTRSSLYHSEVVTRRGKRESTAERTAERT
ncbi:MAG: hypothetical protein P8L85_23320, partial [Rubripirellula sp.]|nr:hypothetical protein [Rubripirellula sp.]